MRSYIILLCLLPLSIWPQNDLDKELQKAGYTHVLNLYDGIFEWVNNGLKVNDYHNNLTKKVHAYERFWRRYLENGLKVY